MLLISDQFRRCAAESNMLFTAIWLPRYKRYIDGLEFFFSLEEERIACFRINFAAGARYDRSARICSHQARMNLQDMI